MLAISISKDVLDGEPVFARTRLSVCSIGCRHAAGDSVESIIEDYPYLTKDDVEQALLFWIWVNREVKLTPGDCWCQ